MWSDIFQHGVKLIECSFSQVRAPSSGHFRKKYQKTVIFGDGQQQFLKEKKI